MLSAHFSTERPTYVLIASAAVHSATAPHFAISAPTTTSSLVENAFVMAHLTQTNSVSPVLQLNSLVPLADPAQVTALLVHHLPGAALLVVHHTLWLQVDASVTQLKLW